MHRLSKNQQEAFIDLLHTKDIQFFDYTTINLYESWSKEEEDREFYEFKVRFLTMDLPKWVYELFEALYNDERA